MALHETEIAYARQVVAFLNHVTDLGATNAIITAATADATAVAQVRAAVEALSAHETDKNILRHGSSAIKAAADVACLTGAELNAATTIAGAITEAAEADGALAAGVIPTTERKSFAYSPRS